MQSDTMTDYYLFTLSNGIVTPAPFWLLVVLRIYVASAVFQPYRDLEAGDNQSLKIEWRCRESNPGPLAPQAKRLTTRPPPLPCTFLDRPMNK